MSSRHLHPEDFYSPTWTRLTAHLNERLRELRERNDRHATESETAAIRGSIAEVKCLLALSEMLSASEDVQRFEALDDFGAAPL